MPGPPPPSASYLLKIVDSSDEEDDDMQIQDRSTAHSITDDDEELADADEEELADATSFLMEEAAPDHHHPRSDSAASSLISTSPPKKKKKKKRKKKKKNNNNNNTQDSIRTVDSNDNAAVSFGDVIIHSFERCLGPDVIPYDGGWPLGLGEAVGDDATSSVSIEEYEANKQERLRIRAQELDIDVDEGKVLETRQWDYKHKAKNPLFHLLQEEQRMIVLLKSSTPPEEWDELDLSDNHSKHKKHHKKRDSKHAPSSPPTTRSRSGSFSHQERYNDTFTQVQVHHVRHELEELRFQRTGEGHTGCTCRKLDVYLLPPNAGKKAHHRRMNVKRVKDELKKRHMLPQHHKDLTRDELELLLHDTVKQEGCCSSADCPCVRNGIECQADVCECWFDSHQTQDQKHPHQSQTEITEIQARCGNANGMYAVDLTKIEQVRKRILQTANNGQQVFICPPVSDSVKDNNNGVADMVMVS